MFDHVRREDNPGKQRVITRKKMMKKRDHVKNTCSHESKQIHWGKMASNVIM